MLKIVRVDFPCLDNPKKFKARPVLCLTKPIGRHKLVVVSYITTSREENLPSDVHLESNKSYFKKTGLVFDSTIKLHKITTISWGSVKCEVGIIPADKKSEVRQKLKKLFGCG